MAEEKLRLEIPVLLPNGADACEHCVQELTKALKRRPGVVDAHVRAERTRGCAFTSTPPSSLRPSCALSPNSRARALDKRLVT